MHFVELVLYLLRHLLIMRMMMMTTFIKERDKRRKDYDHIRDKMVIINIMVSLRF